MKEIENLEFEIFVLKQKLNEIKNEDEKENLKRELKKAQRKYNNISKKYK